MAPSFFTAIFESLFPSDWAAFDPQSSSPYNLSTYRGRIAHFYTILDPRTLLISEQQLKEYLQLLRKFKEQPSIVYKTTAKDAIDSRMNSKLWTAKLMKDSVVHPDTQKPIFWAFRFSAFPVLNIPITTLLLYPGSPALTVFSQFVNQTYNVAVNYANRNASNPMTPTKIAVSYVAAVGASCGIGFGLRKLTRNVNLANSVFLRGFIPYTAITLASCSNLYFIRWNEVTEGITLRIKAPIKRGMNEMKDVMKHSKGQEEEAYEWREVGQSKRAGHIALVKCCVARMIWSIPPLFFPPVIMRALFTKRAWFNQLRQWQKMSIESSVIGAVLFTFIPPSLATFPHRDSVGSEWLEKEFQENFEKDTVFYFNKGL